MARFLRAPLGPLEALALLLALEAPAPLALLEAPALLLALEALTPLRARGLRIQKLGRVSPVPPYMGSNLPRYHLFHIYDRRKAAPGGGHSSCQGLSCQTDSVD